MAHPFYADLPHDTAERIEGLSRLSFELKNNRTALLERYGVADEEALLERLRTGEIAEHPAYDHYLSARILHRTRQAARAELDALLSGRSQTGESEEAAPLHLELQEAIAARHWDRLAAAVEVLQDALLIRLDNGVVLEVRYASPAEYGFHWVWGEAEMRLDTAPVHGALDTVPHHLHDTEGQALAAPITAPDRPPRENLSAVIKALLADPLLGASIMTRTEPLPPTRTFGNIGPGKPPPPGFIPPTTHPQ